MKTAYKLFRRKRDGSLGPLFINRALTLQVGRWYKAETHPTKGFALRPGWHAMEQPVAPHLKTSLKSGEKRIWCKVSLLGVIPHQRPASQGANWFLAQWLRIDEVLEVA